MTTATLPKILVVDDTPANLLVMRRLLAKVEVELVEVASGAAALSACGKKDEAPVVTTPPPASACSATWSRRRSRRRTTCE